MSGSLSKMMVSPSATLLEAMKVIDQGAHGIAFVCDKGGRVLGTLTDGDVRRAILSGASLEGSCLESVMHRSFVAVDASATRTEVLDMMRVRSINQVPILDETGRLMGVHLLKQLVGAVERPHWAVILAGGKGTRLHPITQELPKPMLRVAGRPILERLVLHLVGWGIRRVFLSVNYLANVIEEHFGDGDGFGCRIEYLREGAPLGTGGPLSLLPGRPEHPTLVLNGDLVTQANIGRLLEFHEKRGFAATFGVRPYSVEIPFGVAETDGDLLVGLREKPTERRLINAGIYVLSPDVIDYVPSGHEYPITDLFKRCLRDGLPVGVHLIEDEWADIGRPEELGRARGQV